MLIKHHIAAMVFFGYVHMYTDIKHEKLHCVTARRDYMESTADPYREIIRKFTAWAEEQHNIRAAMVVGSRARTSDNPADEWSDLDIAVFADNPKAFLSDCEWIKETGKYWLTFLEPSGAGHGMERRVLYEGGSDVDFAVFSTSDLPIMLSKDAPADVQETLHRGVEAILDKDERLKDLEVTEKPYRIVNLPSQADFNQLVSDFLYHAVWTAKKLRRGEFLTAKECSDDYMKERLIRMAKWHALANQGQGYDTWHGVRFFEQWADPRVITELRDAFAHYKEDDIWRSLFATLDLFRWIANETADKLGLSYLTAADRHVAELIQALHSDRT